MLLARQQQSFPVRFDIESDGGYTIKVETEYTSKYFT
jgi:hypothetical protein